MYAWQIFYQRRRRMLVQLGTLLAIGLGGTLTLMPRVDATPAVAHAGRSDELNLLLSPNRVASGRFLAEYERAFG